MAGVTRGRSTPARALLALAAVTVTAAGLLVLGAGTASPAPRTLVPGARLATSSETYEARVQQHVNRRRAAHGLRALRFERCTDGVAEAWSATLALRGSLVHQDPAGILDACGARYAAETLGRGRYTPKALVRAWMRSPYHRPVLLSRRATRIGIGATRVDGAWLTAASFTRL